MADAGRGAGCCDGIRGEATGWLVDGNSYERLRYWGTGARSVWVGDTIAAALNRAEGAGTLKYD